MTSLKHHFLLDPEIIYLNHGAFGTCPTKTVLFGCVFNSDAVMEMPESIASRLLEAAEVLSTEQIQAAPDCGLVTMTHDKAMIKLRRMVAGAALARQQAGCV